MSVLRKGENEGGNEVRGEEIEERSKAERRAEWTRGSEKRGEASLRVN